MNFLHKAGFLLDGIKTLYSRSFSISDPNLAAAYARIGGNVSLSGKSVTTDTAPQVMAAWACIRILAETIGALPRAIYEIKGDNATKIDHDLTPVLLGISPNRDMDGVECTEAKVTNLALAGNTYSMVDRNGAKNVSSIYPMESCLVRPMRDRVSGVITYEINDRGKWDTYPREKIWHVKGFGANGLIGYSPVGMAMQAFGLAMALEEFGSRFFLQGAKSSGIISLPTFLTDDQRKLARENLQAKDTGLENMHKFMLLEGNATYTAATMPLDEAQFLTLRVFQLQEICRLYRIPPHMVADLSKSSFSNIEQMSLEFVMHALMPYIIRLEMSASRWIFKPEERSKYVLRFNVEGLLRGDSAARKDLYASMLQNGILSRNEVRALENRNRVNDPSMDAYTVQANMVDIKQLAELVAARILSGGQASPTDGGNGVGVN